MFTDVVSSSEQLMGVKAVWGRSREAIMCFGSRGDANLKDRGYFSQARTTAERSLAQPYFITIGGGEHVASELRGRVIELIRATGVYGETKVFVRDDDLGVRLAQWPVAIIVSEIYSFIGEPRIVEDLGFSDRKILANAYDSIIRDNFQIKQLWESLKNWEIERRWDINPPPDFRDPGKVQLCGSNYPRLDSHSEEGRRVWKRSQEIERDAKLRREAKARNRIQNGGVLVCEACGFSDDMDALFDAHHLQPLAVGTRITRLNDIAILCPTCHRWVHAKAEDRLYPLPIGEIKRI